MAHKPIETQIHPFSLKSAVNSFCVIIPARLSSTRLPNKPLADIHGLPMIVRVALRAAQSHATRVVVACDDPRIQEVCLAHQIECVMTKSTHLSGSDRLAEACELLKLDDQEVVVNVQGDEPLIEPELINEVAAKLHANANSVMSTVAHPIQNQSDFDNPNVVKVVLSKSSRALYFTRCAVPFWRDAPKRDGNTFAAVLDSRSYSALRHVGLYAYKASFLKRFPLLEPSPLERIESLEQLRVLWHDFSIEVHVSPNACASGVDTPEDLERVRQQLAK
jgi:3-deoxy-manno-octulosonate cytidylyltransferase (CMP-KDO synthetase)